MIREKLIAVIPARSGSKGLKDKNIKLLNGKPLMAYTIEAAKASEVFNTIHVSTDSTVYADIARQYGADEPFLRNKESAEDTSSSWSVVKEVLRKYREIGKAFDVCVLLQPTSPMRTGEDIKQAYRMFVEEKADSLTSACEVDHPVQWCFKLDERCNLRDVASSPYKYSRRQDLEKYYRENGAIYITRAQNIEDPAFDFYTERCFAYIMDQEKSIDIDSIQDFMIAETLMKHYS